MMRCQKRQRCVSVPVRQCLRTVSCHLSHVLTRETPNASTRHIFKLAAAYKLSQTSSLRVTSGVHHFHSTAGSLLVSREQSTMGKHGLMVTVAPTSAEITFSQKTFCLKRTSLLGTIHQRSSCWEHESLTLLLSQPLWRFTSAPPDGRLLVYRSEDIRNLSRLRQPSVCGYLSSDSVRLLPDSVRAAILKGQEDKGRCLSPHSTSCCSFTCCSVNQL